ncbi:MAG TPA: 2-dehydropantoate 2-reductase, partial [Terriglobales bacterium]|nr:2-dehydropantoate 2-reductase [Terriglobales bacterium]
MRIAILGAGGIGGYYGGVLARQGNEVHVLARGANLAALQEKGLEVRTPESSFVARVSASEDPRQLGAVDFALVAVKTYSLPEIAPAARELASAGALIIPLLNGVDIADRLIALGVPVENIVGGLTTISAARVGPGVFERRSSFQQVVIGELRPGGRNRELRGQLDSIVQAFREAGVDARVADDIQVEIWRKFAFIASMAAACGLARAPVGAVRAAPLGPLLIERAIREVVKVGRARGINLTDEDADRILKFAETLPAPMKPSLLLDLEAGGRTEIDDLCGAVAR